MRRPRSWKLGVLAVTLTVTLALLGSSAFAAQNVGNTSQKGSLLIFPYIVVGEDRATLVHISNAHQSQTVRVQCFWQNEFKVVVNFAFDLTAKGSIVIDAKSGKTSGGSGRGNVNSFPRVEGAFGGFEFSGQTGDGSPQTDEGELVCFAVTQGSVNQISFNHLTGQATVVGGTAETEQINAFEYSAWSFTARQPLGTVMGAPGTLVLDGVLGYDACPQALIANYNPEEAEVHLRSLDVEFGKTRLGISTCTQDLREIHASAPDFVVTRLNLNVWNAEERKFSGAFECADSTWIFTLDDEEVDFNPTEVFEKGALGTKTALIKVQPVVDFRCSNFDRYTVAAPGLVGVAATRIELENSEEIEVGIGTNLFGQGQVVGSIQWTTGEPEPEAL